MCLQFLSIDHPITETLLLVILVWGPEMVCEEWPQWDLRCTFQWQSFVASHPSEGPDHDLSVPRVDSQGWRLAGLSSNCIFPLPWPGITAQAFLLLRRPDPRPIACAGHVVTTLQFILHPSLLGPRPSWPDRIPSLFSEHTLSSLCSSSCSWQLCISL